MTRSMIQQYAKLVEFLGFALGPDYEVTLHDLTNEKNSIVAISNGHISGRRVGAPLTNIALKIIADREYEHSDHLINYSGISVGNKMLRSSTLFIKDDGGGLVGLLCINFDDSRYKELSTRVMQLCHPDLFVDKNIYYSEDTKTLEESAGEEPEKFHNSISAVADDLLQKAMADSDIPPERLTQDEKMRIVGLLDQKGVFRLKGAVGHVADKLCCSQASIYRYISRINKDKERRPNDEEEQYD